MSKLRYVDSSAGPGLRNEKEQTVARLTWGYGRKREDAEALGPLLAAAPEMLEALKEFPFPSVSAEENRNYYQRVNDWHRKYAEAAIAKAEGRE